MAEGGTGYQDRAFSRDRRCLVVLYAHCLLQPRQGQATKRTRYGYSTYAAEKQNGATIRAPDLGAALEVDERSAEVGGRLPGVVALG